MIYQEIVLSAEDTFLARSWVEHYCGPVLPKDSVTDKKRKQKRDDALNLMLTNKQIRLEASEILSEGRFLQSTIGFSWFSKVDDDMVKVAADEIQMCPPTQLLQSSRNFKVILPSLWYDMQDPLHAGHSRILQEEGAYAQKLDVFCTNIASKVSQTKHIDVYLPCYCSSDDYKSNAEFRHLYGLHKERCFPTTGLTRVLAPLRKLRARHIRFVQECKSRHIAELHAIFQDITTVVQSSTPADASVDQIEWCNILSESKRRRIWNMNIHYDLREAWLYLNDIFAEHREAFANDYIFGYERDALRESETHQDRYQRLLRRARQMLDERTWEEELMASVAMADSTQPGWWDEDLMLEVVASFA
ncbi:MAG: hypothetical protein Q9168_003485 [Polycauliona sp. 1 TL-2023]